MLSRAYYSVGANTAHKITGHSCTITNSVTEATCGNDKALAMYGLDLIVKLEITPYAIPKNRYLKKPLENIS